MVRPTTALNLTAEEKAALSAWAEQGDPNAPATRPARILLLLDAGRPGIEVARATGTSPQTVCAWRQRFLRQRLAALPARPLPPVPPPAPTATSEGEPPLQPVTLQHIADLVQVHKSTVHRILRREPGRDSELARRIRTAAHDLGYRPEANHAARQLALRRFHRPEARRLIFFYQHAGTFRSPFHLRQFTGAMDVLAGTRFDIMVRLSDDLAERQLPTAVERGEVAAVISQDCTGWIEIQQALLARLHPSLRPALVGMLRDLPGIWSATVDFHAAGRALIGHLLDLGHRRFIAIEQRSQVTAGFRAELQARGLDPERALRCMHAVPGDAPMRERTAETLRLLLAAQPQATALLASHDPEAITALEILAQWGRPAPAAMSVAGFDCTHAAPGATLTTIELPLEEIGRAAARMAMEPGATPRCEVLPGMLRPGTTAGPPPTA